MSDHVVGSHNELHSDQGARKGEHPGQRPPVLRRTAGSVTAFFWNMLAGSVLEELTLAS
jgi:hypothetical protein